MYGKMTTSRMGIIGNRRVSDFSFEDGDELFPRARKVAGNIAKLKQRFLDEGKQVLYVNDNEEGKLHDVGEMLTKARSSSKGREILKKLEQRRASRTSS